MKDKIERISLEASKADAFLYAYEHCFLENHGAEAEMESSNKGVHAFYGIWDCVKRIEQMLDELAGEATVIDAIQAAKESRCENCTYRSNPDT